MWHSRPQWEEDLVNQKVERWNWREGILAALGLLIQILFCFAFKLLAAAEGVSQRESMCLACTRLWARSQLINFWVFPCLSHKLTKISINSIAHTISISSQYILPLFLNKFNLDFMDTNQGWPWIIKHQCMGFVSLVKGWTRKCAVASRLGAIPSDHFILPGLGRWLTLKLALKVRSITKQKKNLDSTLLDFHTHGRTMAVGDSRK